MNVGLRLSSVSDKASKRYAQMLVAFKAALAEQLVSNKLILAKRNELEAELYRIANEFLQDESEIILDDVDNIGNASVVVTDGLIDGVESEGLASEVLEHLDQIATSLDNAMRLQIERDIAVVMGALRNHALRSAIVERSGASKNSKGNSSTIASDALQRLDFAFLDKSGKTWNSQRHVRVLWRQALVDAWNESALMRMAEVGIEQAMILHPDQSHEEYGTVISLNEDPTQGVLWADIKNDVFHPNTQAWVVPLVEKQSQKSVA